LCLLHGTQFMSEEIKEKKKPPIFKKKEKKDIWDPKNWDILPDSSTDKDDPFQFPFPFVKDLD